MERKIKEQLIKSANCIKSKIRQIRNVEDNTDLIMRTILKPVAQPLKSLVESKSFPERHEKQILGTNNISVLNNEIEEVEDDNSSLFSDCENELANSSSEILESSIRKDDVIDIYDTMDIPFGVRSENKKVMIGNSEVKFTKTDNHLTKGKTLYISIDKNHYELTPGLTQLLLRKKPDLSIVSDKDKIIYKDILNRTNVHKRDFKSNGQIKGDKSIKYREIIKPMFSELFDIYSKQGGRLPTLKKYMRNTDYIYWDDPNELIDRLKLLVASKDAGNQNHDNEILSIVEELKEAGIVKK